MTIRVLLADDHAAIRSGLRVMLEQTGEITVVGEAADGRAAVANARALDPDVVLMDIRMPGMDGIEATREIVATSRTGVLVLTTFDDDAYVFGALRAGAAGFLLKTVAAADLVEAVRRVAAGEGVVSPEVTRSLLAEFARSPVDDRPPTEVPELSTLTAREREVLAALGRGLSNAALAAELGISEATAKTHVSSVLAKTGCTSRMQAAVLARESGLA